MKIVKYRGKIKSFIDGYDLKNHKVWDAVSGDMPSVRKHIKDHYLKEQKYCCAYCRMEKKEKHGQTWDVEHILPKSKFPAYLFEPRNLAIACRECNAPKDARVLLTRKLRLGGAYPKTSARFKIIHPHYDKYSEHIEISVIERKRRYRVLNEKKGKETYIACNLFRFDHQFGEWTSFDAAMVQAFSRFLDNCPPNSSPNQIKTMLSFFKFEENRDF